MVDGPPNNQTQFRLPIAPWTELCASDMRLGNDLSQLVSRGAITLSPIIMEVENGYI